MFNLAEYTDADGKATAYSWPGGYPVYYITGDGGALCPACVTKERERIAESIADNANDGWKVEAAGVNYEDASLYCDHCNKRIESAYAEDEAEKGGIPPALAEKMKAFADAALALSDAWQAYLNASNHRNDYMASAYPSAWESFDEMAHKALIWYQYTPQA